MFVLYESDLFVAHNRIPDKKSKRNICKIWNDLTEPMQRIVNFLHVRNVEGQI
jgi:hypothetical protein